MALVEAYYALDYRDINLNFYVQNYDGEDFVDGGGIDWDILHVFSTYGTALSHYGWDYTLNSGGFVDGGTVETLVEWVQDAVSYDWFAVYAISGISTSIQNFFDVAQTPSISDELALLRALLSGNDKFLLSDFDDVMNGFRGRDKMFGYAGDDYLQGGTGKDKLVGGSGEDTLKGGSGDDLIRGGKGRDVEIGGKGEDTFLFKTGDDKAIIKDFDARGSVHDVVDLSGLKSVSGWSDLVNNHMEKDGADIVIDGGDGDVIVLRDVTLSSLDKGDFLF